MAFAILCPCGEVVAAGDPPAAWIALNAHQAACGQAGFVAYESGETETDARAQVEEHRPRPDSTLKTGPHHG